MINKVILQGRLTADVELKSTPNGISVATFTVAVDRAYKSGEEKKADFINCVAWRGTAEFLSRNFRKGQELVTEGELQTRSYEKDGQKRFVTEVIVSNVHFCGPKAQPTVSVQNDDSGWTPVATGAAATLDGDLDDDLPF